MGIAAGDYDNDGAANLLLTSVGSVRLFRNAGGGRFTDATTKAGLGGRRAFSTSAMWFDYDKDGHLNLLICNYVQWTPQSDVFCSADGKAKSYCTPDLSRQRVLALSQQGRRHLRRRHRQGRFLRRDVEVAGVTLLDYDQDGWPDVFVANDTQPNKLYRNNGNGTFTELGLKAGVAFSEEGRARAGMGVDAVDLDGSGRPTVAVTNFSGEMLGLFAPVGWSIRTSIARRVGHRPGHAPDARPGLLLLRRRPRWPAGSARRQRTSRRRACRQRRPGRRADRYAAPVPERRGRFTHIARDTGATFATPKMGRGAAFADIDADGDLDAVITDQRRPRPPLSHRPAGGEPQRAVAPGRHDVEPRRHRRARRSASARRPRRASSAPDPAICPNRSCRCASASAPRRKPTRSRSPGRAASATILGALDAGQEYTVTEGKGVTGKRATRPTSGLTRMSRRTLLALGGLCVACAACGSGDFGAAMAVEAE